MKNKLEKYDKLITAGLVVIAFIFGIGWWFAEEKSEPVYLSKIDRLMFDKDNKAVIGSDLVNWILEDRLNCRVQLQLHKILSVR